jgi:hypothetical protein
VEAIGKGIEEQMVEKRNLPNSYPSGYSSMPIKNHGE